MSALRLAVHDDAPGFVAAADAFLRLAEAENNAIAAGAARMVSAPNDDDVGCYLATVSDATGVIGAASMGASGTVLLTAAPDAAIALVANDLADRERKLKGLVGPLTQCEAFARVWCERTGQAHVLRFHLRHFELTGNPVLTAAPGRLRLPDTGEHALIVDWQDAFFDEVGLTDDRAPARRNVLRRVERGLVRLWDDDGVVSYIGFGESAAGTARIAPVYTPPRFRGRGYASAMVGELSRQLLDAGKRAIFLTTDVANPTSNGIYQRIGFRPVADHFHFDFVAPQI